MEFIIGPLARECEQWASSASVMIDGVAYVPLSELVGVAFEASTALVCEMLHLCTTVFFCGLFVFILFRMALDFLRRRRAVLREAKENK